MAWVKLITDTNSSATPFSTAASATTYEGDAARTSSNGTNMRAYTVIGGTFNGGGTGTEIGDGAWHHIALVRSANNALNLYVDGSFVHTESTSVASRASASAAFLTLISATDASPHNNPWAGRVAYPKVWTAALSGTEITAEMAYGPPLRTANLWDWWTLSGGNYNGQYAANNWSATGTISDVDDDPLAYDEQPAYVVGKAAAGDSQPAYTVGASAAVDVDDAQPAYTIGRATVTDSQAAYTAGTATTSDEQPAYVVGSINVADSQPAYAAGIATTTDTQPAYTIGRDTAADNQPAYALGVAGSIDSQPAYTAGTATTADSQAAFAVGSLPTTDAQPAYTAGRAVATDSQPAFTFGGSNLAGEQPAYTSGQATTADEQAAYTSGRAVVSDSLPAHVTGKATTSDEQSAYVVGSPSIAKPASALSTYSQTGTGISSFSFNHTVPAGLRRGVFVIVCAWRNSDTTAFTVAPTFDGAAMTEVGSFTTTTNNRYYLVSIWRTLAPAVTGSPVVVAGTYSGATINDQVVHALSLNGVDQVAPTGVTGSSTTGANKSVTLTTTAAASWLLGGFLAYGGVSTLFPVGATVEDDERATGSGSTSDITVGLYHLVCGAAGSHTIQAETNGETRGVFGVVEVRADAQVDMASEQPAYVVGKSTATDAQPAYAVGTNAVVDSQPAYLFGGDILADEQSAYAAGVASTTDSQAAYVVGDTTISDSQPAYTTGVPGATDAQPAYAVGVSTTTDSQPAYLFAGIIVTGSTPAYTTGRGAAVDSQPAYAVGGVNVADGQPAHAVGKATTIDSQPAYAVGTAGDQIYVATTGSDGSGDGSSDAPYATVNKAVSVAGPGDTIVVRNGTYNQRISISGWSGGDANNKLTIRAENALGATIAGVNNTLYVIEVVNSSWIVFEDLYVQYGGATVPGVRNHPIYFHGTNSDIRVTGCSVTKLGMAPTETAMKNDYNAGYRDVGINFSGTNTRMEIDHCAIRGLNRDIAGDGTNTLFKIHRNRLHAVQSCINIRYGNSTPGRHFIAYNDFEYSYMEDGSQNQPDPALPSGTIDTSYFFYYRNLFHALGENCIDTKGCERVYFTQNVFHGNFGNNNGRHPTLQTIGGSPLMVTCGANQQTRYRVGFDNVVYDNSAGFAVWDDHYYHNLIWDNRRRDTVSNSGTGLTNYKGFAYTEGSGKVFTLVNNIIGRQYYGSSLRDYASTDGYVDGNAYINCDNVGLDAKNNVAKTTLAAWQTWVQAQGWSGPGEANSYEGTDAAADLFVNFEEYPVDEWDVYDWSVKPTASALYQQGVHITTATSNTVASLTLPVANADLFYGSMGRDDLPQQDIYIEGVGARKITDVSWSSSSTGTITLDAPATVANGAKIYHGTSATPNIGTFFFEVGPDAPEEGSGGGGGTGGGSGTAGTITAGTVAHYEVSGATNTFSFGATIPSGSDLALFLIVLAWKTSETAFTVAPTFNGSPMTEVYSASTTTTSRYYLASIWRVLNPAVGAGTVAGTYSSNANDQVIFALPLIGVDQAAPTGATGNDTAGDWDVAMTTTVENAWLLGGTVVYGGDNTLGVGGSTVKDDQQVSGTSATADITGGLFHLVTTTAGSYTLQSTANNDTKGLSAAVVVNPAAAGAWSGSQPAFVVGGLVVSDSQGAYVIGKDAASAELPAHAAGRAGDSQTQTAYTVGKATTTDNQSAYTVGTAALADDSQSAYTSGQDTDAGEVAAHTHGKATTVDGQIAYVVGSATASDSQLAYAVGVTTASDSQLAYAVGANGAVDGLLAYVVGVSSNALEQIAYTIGQDTDAGSQSAFVVGDDATSGSLPGYTTGASEISAALLAYVGGQQSATDSRPAYTRGQNTAASEQIAHTRGQATATAGQIAHLAGRADATGAQIAYTIGQDAISAILAAYAIGQNTDAAAQPAHVTGQATDVGEQISHAVGKDTASDGQPAYLFCGTIVRAVQPAYLFATSGLPLDWYLSDAAAHEWELVDAAAHEWTLTDEAAHEWELTDEV